MTCRSLAACLCLTPKGNLRAWGPRLAGLSSSIRRGPRPPLPAPAGLWAAPAALSPVLARSVGGVPCSRPGRRRRDGTRARASGGRGARPPGTGTGEERPPARRRSRAQRTRLGPGANCCSPRELGGDAESPVPRSARGTRRGRPRRSREQSLPPLSSVSMSRTPPLLRPRGGDPGPRRRAQP